MVERGEVRFPLDGRELKVGRDASCDICLSGVGVSRLHAVIRCDAPNPVVIDSGSTFGTRLDGAPVESAALADGSVLTVGIQDLRVGVGGGEICFALIDPVSAAPRTDGGGKDVIKIGRDTENDICLPHPMVSRFHAVVKSASGGLAISDLGSANSTYVNGRAVGTAALGEGDVVHVGPFRFYVSGGKFCRADDLNKIKIEAHALGVRLKGKKLLDNIDLTIEPGAFVALLGASGAGKSTLSKVLSGQLAPTSGRLFMNGFPASRFSAAFERGMGYVAQQILLRPELTVWETLSDQALIRLPGDSTQKERLIRAGEVMELMGLAQRRDNRVATLSGGEARRLHVGVELLASPAVVILDEPLAGLDPGLIGKFMQLFRRICDKGHTLILITHTLEQIELCDRIVYMQTGRVLFSGPPNELCGHFGVESLSQVYGQAPLGASGQAGEAGRQVTERITPRQLGHGYGLPRGEWANALRHLVRTAASFARQASALTSRYSKVYARDSRNILLLMVQTPLITLLLGLVYKTSINQFTVDFYFCLTVTGIWVGGLDAVREVAAELPLLAREVKCGMNRLSYIIARITAASALSAVQALLFAVSVVVVFHNLTFSMELLILLFTAILSGNLMGLAVSVCSGNVGRAISTLPIVLIPQIFFSGMIVSFEHMSKLGEQLSHLTISRPVFGVMKRVFLLDSNLGWHDEWTELLLLCVALIIIFGIALRVRTGRRASI